MAQLVSIVIPAYSERFFPEAFRSALAQTHAAIEIVVCDDSPGTAIQSAVAAAADPRVRYTRNPTRLGFAGNFTRCFSEARGELVKFLNDDDRLMPSCVAVLAAVLEANPHVTLATSRRRVIDEQGRECAPIHATMPVSLVSALVAGRELGDLVLTSTVNMIGEPTTAMFRRSQLAVEGDSVFAWGGKEYHCLADLSLWLRLLRSGLAYYGAQVLSEYRMHTSQEQDQPGMRLKCLVERLWIAREARRAGFLASAPSWEAALRNLLARAQAWHGLPLDEPTRRGVEEFCREVEAELASGSHST